MTVSLELDIEIDIGAQIGLATSHRTEQSQFANAVFVADSRDARSGNVGNRLQFLLQSTESLHASMQELRTRLRLRRIARLTRLEGRKKQ